MDTVRDLDCGIKEAEHEIEVWKSRFRELETEFLRTKQELEKEISVQLEKELEALILSKISVENELKELESQVGLKLKHEVEMEKELEVYKTKCDGLAVELEEKKRACVVVGDSLKDLMIAKVSVDDELKEYKTTCERLKERIIRIEEDQKVVGSKAKKAQERITYLSKELKKREADEIEKYVCQLKKENKNLKSGKGRAENEIVVWKIKFGELETQAALRLKHENELEKELEVHKTKCHGLSMELEEKTMEGVVIMDKLKDLMLRKMAADDELKRCMTMCNEQKARIMVLEKEKNVLRENEKRAEERITNLSKELRETESETNAQLKKEIKNLESGKSRMENEIEVWKKRSRELETQVFRLNQVTLEKSETEKELEAYKIQCHGLSAELEKKKLECGSVVSKLKDLLLRKIGVDEELKVYKTICNGMKERIMGLEEDQKLQCEKEKRAQDSIINLEEKIKNIESDETEKQYLELVKESKDFKLPKKRAKYDNGIWKKRFKDLETQVSRMKQVELEKTELEKELDILFTNYEEFYKELEEKKMECIAVEEKFEALKLRNIAGEDELKEYKRTCNGLKEQIIDLEEYQKLFIIKGRRAQERISHLEEEVRRMENDRDKPGGLESEVSYNDNRKKDRNIKLQSEMDSRTDGAPHFKIQEKMLIYPDFAGCNHPSLLEGNRDVHVTGPASSIMLSKPLVNVKEESSSKKLALLEKGTVRPASCGMVDISDCDDKQEIPPKHTCNIRAEEIVYVSTDNTSERSMDNEKDLQSKKCLKRPCSDLIEEEYMSTCEEESMTPSRRRLISLRHSEEKMNCGERRSRNENTSPYHLQHKTGNLISKNVKETVAFDVVLVESLGGIIGKCCDSLNSGDSSSDSEDDRDMDLSLNQVIARIKKNRAKDSKWQFEADMLSSFEVDSELCMKAVCALYRQHISEEKSIKGSLHSKNQGFSSHDTLRGSALAEFLMDGNWKGNLKKSVKELEMFDPKALEDCKRLATQYSNQLFDIYQNREDPFFLPSGV